MAITATALANFTSPTMAIFDLIATLDADTTFNVPHGLTAGDGTAVVPAKAYFVQNSAEGRLSDWIVTSITATNAVIAKTIAVGSGAVGIQARLYVEIPHSLLGANTT